MPIRVLSIFGTRPESIKMAPVIQKLGREAGIDSYVCVTGQHRHMLDQVLDLFKIRPHVDLNIMMENQSLTDVGAAVLSGLKPVLEEYRPDLVLVQGDTSTTFLGALAAFYQQISVGHIEAGLRTGDMSAPWPEEMNRRVTSVLASLHFAPTEQAADNLLGEGVDPDSIMVTGNTVIDALLGIVGLIDNSPCLTSKFEEQFSFLEPNRKIVLVTSHRRESFGKRFEQICYGLLELSRRKDVRIIYPVHLNPNVQGPVNRILGDVPNVHLIEPLGYLPFVYLMKESFLILTDSGGVQEEAPSLGKPVLVMRERTERPEGVAAGTVRLVGITTKKIVEETSLLLDSKEEYERMSRAHNPYGDGHAAERIVKRILDYYAL